MAFLTKKAQLKKATKSYRTIHKKAWKLMSEYVRRRDKGICITCGKKDHWKNMQAGHFVHKDCMDFIFENINCQCAQCNKWKHGELGIYSVKLNHKYPLTPEEVAMGIAPITERLISAGKLLKKTGKQELEEKIIILEAAIEGFENEGL